MVMEIVLVGELTPVDCIGSSIIEADSGPNAREPIGRHFWQGQTVRWREFTAQEASPRRHLPSYRRSGDHTVLASGDGKSR